MDKGKSPTLIASGAIFGALALPEYAVLAAGADVISTGADAAAAWGAYQFYLFPGPVAFVGTLINSFVSPNNGSVPGAFAPNASLAAAEILGWAVNQRVNDYYDNQFGP